MLMNMFIKHEYGKKKRQASSMVYDPRPVEMASTSLQEVTLFSERLRATGEDVALLHLLPLPLPLPLPSTHNPTTDLPSPPSVERDIILNELTSQAQPVHYHCIASAGLKLLGKLKYTTDQVTTVEQETRTQQLCRRWQEERKYRITASKFGTVIKCQRNHTNLAKQLLYANVSSGGVSALIWGQQHEADALEAYQTTLSPGLTMHDTGVFIDECGFLGASPDAIVKNGSSYI